MSAHNRPGAVHALLEPFARHGVSMTRARIASRAHRVCGNTFSSSTSRAIATTRRWRRRSTSCAQRAPFLKLLGSYPAAAAPGAQESEMQHRPRDAWRRPITCAARRRTCRASRSPSSRASSGSTEDDIVKLASNENPRGPSARVRDAIAAAAAGVTRYPDGNGFALKNGARGALRRRCRADRARQRLERHPRARDAGVPAAGRRGRLFAALRSRSIRWPRRRAARVGIEVPARDSRPRPRRDARRDRRRHAHRVRRQPEQPDRDLDRAVGVARLRRVGAARACSWCSTRRTTNTFAPSSSPTAPLARRASEPARVAHLLQGVRAGRAACRLRPERRQRSPTMLNRVRQPFNVNSIAQAAAIAALADNGYVVESARAQP